MIIGNPPYNRQQEYYDQNNANRSYRQIDEAIKDTYIRLGTAQNKSPVYDMYTRFFRWASDRLHDDGVIAFVTNSAYIGKAAFDGFRKSLIEDFSEIYMVDLGGDVRANPKLSGTKNNVFGIQIGVAIIFLVKRRKLEERKIYYARRPEMDSAEDKLFWLSSNRFSSISFERIEPDDRGNWLNPTNNDWDELVSLCTKAVKAHRSKEKGALFKLFSLGIASHRDDWVYDFSRDSLEKKIRFFINEYEKSRTDELSRENNSIRWDSDLERCRSNGIIKQYDDKEIVCAEFRPFVKKLFYFDRHLNSRTYQLLDVFQNNSINNSIAFLSMASSHELAVLSSNIVFDLCLLKQGNGGTQSVPRYRYTPSGECLDNITDWGLKQFQAHYGKDRKRPITKDAIFHYVYGVLHDPVYRKKYALNLKREFPRIPFQSDFWRWAEWGEKLMALHIGYETAEPWPLDRIDTPDEKAREAGVPPKTILKADRDNNIIVLDSDTQLTGVPPEAWTYRLGNRSALDWILDQYKEKTPRDPTIRERFNTYRFADYKETVIDLLMRVTRVSIETMEIVEQMRAASDLEL